MIPHLTVIIYETLSTFVSSFVWITNAIARELSLISDKTRRWWTRRDQTYA